jgi:hypothetical protein
MTRLLAVAAAALLVVGAGCDRPRTGGTAYNNSGASATPGSTTPTPGASTSPQVASTTPSGSEGVTGAKSTPTTPDTASPNAPPASAVAEGQGNTASTAK